MTNDKVKCPTCTGPCRILNTKNALKQHGRFLMYESTHDELMAARDAWWVENVIPECGQLQKRITELEAENERLEARTGRFVKRARQYEARQLAVIKSAMESIEKQQAVVEAAREWRVAEEEEGKAIIRHPYQSPPLKRARKKAIEAEKKFWATIDTLGKSKESGGPCWGNTTGKGE